MKDPKKTTVLLTVLSLIALLLTFHPQGVVMNFMGENGEKFPFYYRCWSLMPMGYGNWGPLITGVCAVLSTAFAAAQLITEKPKLYRWIRNVSIAALVGSGINCLLGGMTIYGVAILVLMAATAFLAHNMTE